MNRSSWLDNAGSLQTLLSLMGLPERTELVLIALKQIYEISQ